MAAVKKEMSTKEWLSTFEQARALGAVQLGLSGGEPLLRPDIIELVKAARGMGFYTNLITSALGLTEKKLDQLKDAGLDAVQVSFQSDQKDLNDFIGGKGSYEHKLATMRAVKARGFPLTLNVVIHRLNIDRMAQICQLCDAMEPDYVELASTQFHGWAMQNRKQLMPTPDQVDRAKRAAEEYQAASCNRSDVFYVVPDMIEKRAKPCMQKWGSTYLCVNPAGDVAPCLSADTLPSLEIPNVCQTPLAEIWDGDVFAKYCGVGWMDANDRNAQEHPLRELDGGGCRCQAYALTGSETAMDPVCETAAGHVKFLDFLKEAYSEPTNLSSLMPRTMKNSKLLASSLRAS